MVNCLISFPYCQIPKLLDGKVPQMWINKNKKVRAAGRVLGDTDTDTHFCRVISDDLEDYFYESMHCFKENPAHVPQTLNPVLTLVIP